MQTFLNKLRNVLSRDSGDRAEIETHLNLLAARFEQQGMSAVEARNAARRQFGNASLHQQRLSEMRIFLPLFSLGRDLGFAVRQLRKSPGFALTAILTLALGIGAATAIFSIVNGVLLKPLGYRNSGQLVVVWEHVRFLEKLFPYTGANPLHEQVWKKQNTVFSGISILQERSVPVALSGDRPTLTARILTEPNLLDVLQVQPAIGRDFLPGEALKGHDHVAILTWPLWQSLFQGDVHVVGRSFRMGEDSIQVIGVLPRDFYFPKSNELSPASSSATLPEAGFLMPIAGDVSDLGSLMGDFGNYVAIGRLKPGVTPAQAEAQLDTLCANIVRQVPANQMPGERDHALTTYIQPLKDVIVNQSRRALWLLLAAVLSLLLIACINLANAQLARAVARDRESAVRSALGASALALIQSSFAETLLLSFAGSSLGIVLAYLAVRRFSAIASGALPRIGNVDVDPVVLGLSIALTVGATLAVGLFPALRQLRIRPQQALQNSSTRTAGSRRGYRIRRWLIGAQIFACTALLLITGLFAKSLLHLLTFDKGFDSSHVLNVEALLPAAGKSTAPQIAFVDATLEKLRSLPGVQSAALVSSIFQGDVWLDGVTRSDRRENPDLANFRWISPNYFATLQQHILKGRDLDAHDRDQKSAVISEATAKAVWPDEDPIGHKFSRSGDGVLFTVVGIVADAHVNSLRKAPPSMVYLPYWNRPYGSFLIRTTQDPALLAADARKAIWDYSPAVIVTRTQTLDAQIGNSLSSERLETTILTAFGASALVLALLGIYGTLSYSVATRRQEIGVRMALGATRGAIYANTLREIVTPLTAGLLLGWLTSLAIGRMIAALLYNTAPTDPTVALAAITLFLIAATAATILPCRRAATVDPMEALRAE